MRVVYYGDFTLKLTRARQRFDTMFHYRAVIDSFNVLTRHYIHYPMKIFRARNSRENICVNCYENIQIFR